MADDPLVALAVRVGERCLALDVRIATVESCTGGLIGHVLTEIPGSSAYYVGGFVTYADEAKRTMVGVPAEVLAGARRGLGADRDGDGRRWAGSHRRRHRASR